MNLNLRASGALPWILCISLGAHAQSSDGAKPGAGLEATKDLGGVTLFASQKLWAATWEQPLLDVQLGVDQASGAPVARQSFVSVVSDTRILPLTTLGLRYRDLSLSTTLMPKMSFTTEGKAPGDRIKRDEYDLGIGYSVNSQLSGSLIYKTGKISQGATSNAINLAGVGGSSRLETLLLGVSAYAPLQGNWSVYGNAAIGPARSKVQAPGIGNPTYHGQYRIGEIGFAYAFRNDGPIFGFIKGMSFQVGYRTQIVTIRNAQTATYSVGPSPALLSTERKRLQSTTQGLVIGISAAF